MPQKKIIKKFNYPLELIEELILNINDYKEFLPWCNNSKIISKKDHGNLIDIMADLEIGYSIARDTYTSHVMYDKKEKKITVNAVHGPLKNLENIWLLKKKNKNECEVTFYINLELKNIMLNKILSSMFDIGFEKILQSFENRAEYLNNLNK